MSMMDGTVSADGADVEVSMTLRMCRSCKQPFVVRDGVLRSNARISLVDGVDGGPSRLEVTPHVVGCPLGPT